MAQKSISTSFRVRTAPETSQNTQHVTYTPISNEYLVCSMIRVKYMLLLLLCYVTSHKYMLLLLLNFVTSHMLLTTKEN